MNKIKLFEAILKEDEIYDTDNKSSKELDKLMMYIKKRYLNKFINYTEMLFKENDVYPRLGNFDMKYSTGFSGKNRFTCYMEDFYGDNYILGQDMTLELQIDMGENGILGDESEEESEKIIETLCNDYKNMTLNSDVPKVNYRIEEDTIHGSHPYVINVRLHLPNTLEGLKSLVNSLQDELD